MISTMKPGMFDIVPGSDEKFLGYVGNLTIYDYV